MIDVFEDVPGLSVLKEAIKSACPKQKTGNEMSKREMIFFIIDCLMASIFRRDTNMNKTVKFKFPLCSNIVL